MLYDTHEPDDHTSAFRALMVQIATDHKKMPELFEQFWLEKKQQGFVKTYYGENHNVL